MPSFSRRSEAKLNSCDDRLQRIMRRVVENFDCTILCGHRGFDEQEKAFLENKSKARWGESLHNKKPSLAVDVAPYPIDWKDRDRFHYFAGFVMATATELNRKLRWGGDWDRDTETDDNRFDDLVHFEIQE